MQAAASAGTEPESYLWAAFGQAVPARPGDSLPEAGEPLPGVLPLAGGRGDRAASVPLRTRSAATGPFPAAAGTSCGTSAAQTRAFGPRVMSFVLVLVHVHIPLP